VHDIPDGSERVDPFDPESKRIRPDEDKVNIMGTPLGSKLFVSSYLQGKGMKHRLLLQFIKYVAAAGFPREAEHMRTGAAVPRLSHLLRSVKMNHATMGWMREMDSAYLYYILLDCLTVSEDLEHALGPLGRDHLFGPLDLPATCGCAGLQSLESSADEEFLGFFAWITTALISFCKETGLSVYIWIAEALGISNDPKGSLDYLPISGVREMKDMTVAMKDRLSKAETTVATPLVRGLITVKVPGRCSSLLDLSPEAMTLQKPHSFGGLCHNSLQTSMQYY
jgi:hypothetical protein